MKTLTSLYNHIPLYIITSVMHNTFCIKSKRQEVGPNLKVKSEFKRFHQMLDLFTKPLSCFG